jgi:hypothetical protein
MSARPYDPGPQYTIYPAVATRDSRLTPRDLHILSILLPYTNEDAVCLLSQSTIGELAGVSRQIVHKCLGHLAHAGYLKLTPRIGEDGRKATAIIKVLKPEPEVKYLRQMGKGT